MHTFAIKAWFSFRTVPARVVLSQTQKTPFLPFQKFIPSPEIRNDTALV